MTSLHPPPHETPIRRPGSKSFHVCSGFFCISSKVQPFSAWWFPVFEFIAKTASHVGVNNTEHISYILSEWAHGVGIWYVFQPGRKTRELWTVSICIQIAHSNLRDGHACWKVVALEFLFTAAPGISQSRRRPGFISHVVTRFKLCCFHSVSYLLTIRDLSFFTKNFLIRPPTVPAPDTFRSSLVRTSSSKIWPIRHWGGEADSNP